MGCKSHDTTGPAGRSELVVKEMCFRASPVPKQKTTVFKFKEPSTLSLAINIHQRALDLLEQCKWLTKASIYKIRPCPTEEKTLRQIRASASWEFNSCHRDTTTLETPMFAIGVNRSTWGPRPCSQHGFYCSLMQCVFNLRRETWLWSTSCYFNFSKVYRVKKIYPVKDKLGYLHFMLSCPS